MERFNKSRPLSLMRVPRVKSGTRGQSNLMLDEATNAYDQTR
jgi:hypothetical protein